MADLAALPSLLEHGVDIPVRATFPPALGFPWASTFFLDTLAGPWPPSLIEGTV